jgi:WD40 repeat protein
VKVLDFGLAKAFAGETANASLSNSPTISNTATQQGLILGTASYMSPEQARGMEVARTSDIWAFGCVFYEMLTGRQAFSGPTVTDILTAILKMEPDWDALPKPTPAGIRKLLSRCLQKDQKRRLHDMADVRIEIEDAPGEISTVTPSVRSWARPLPIAAMVLALAASFGAGLYFWIPRQAPEERIEITTPSVGDFAVSPDGSKLVYASNYEGRAQLFLRALGSFVPEMLPGTAGASNPFWSPNGKSVGFFADGVMKRINLESREVKTLASYPPGDGMNPSGATWNEAGIIVFAPNINTPLFRVTEKGGPWKPVTYLDLPGQKVHMSPKFLPDGQHFLVYVQSDTEGNGAYLGSLNSPKIQRLFDADGPAIYVPAGYLLYISKGTLFAKRFDTRASETIGEAIAVAQNVSAIAASADVIAYRVKAAPTVLTWVDRSGKPLGTVGNEDGISPTISPDEKSVVMYRSEKNNIDVFVLDANHGNVNRLTSNSELDGLPIYSHDGKRIVFGSDRNHKGAQELFTISADGAAKEELLQETTENRMMVAYSISDHYLVYGKREPKSHLYALPLSEDGKATGKPIALANPGDANESSAQFSPNGKWLVFQSDKTGHSEIYMEPFPGPGPKVPISVGGGSQPRWPRNAKELFYVGPDSNLIAVSVTLPVDGLPILGASTIIGLKDRVITGIGWSYDVSPNGQRLLIRARPQQTPPISLIIHWKPPAK